MKIVLLKSCDGQDYMFPVIAPENLTLNDAQEKVDKLLFEERRNLDEGSAFEDLTAILEEHGFKTVPYIRSIEHWDD